MACQTNAFIAVPGICCSPFKTGGYGTVKELLEMMTWSQLGNQDKPLTTNPMVFNAGPRRWQVVFMEAFQIKTFRTRQRTIQFHLVTDILFCDCPFLSNVCVHADVSFHLICSIFFFVFCFVLFSCYIFVLEEETEHRGRGRAFKGKIFFQVERKLYLVYGGGSVGVMGLISQVNGLDFSSCIFVDAVASMHEREAEMAHQTDPFIALPGGYGTMEELLEMITWSQLGIQDKPTKRQSRGRGRAMRGKIFFQVWLNSSLTS
ncbi:uncharacterized protein LOC131858888 [Cryptomeria japonica]|uniref:uncharacterized protein LOC131858888 n=1 Tax=Cryptomeria japonica TaxID=3369 RepID=UPI0027DA16E5|nr:uncharacterized protein LOC131858888 [Cryptomeria japonica]